jgi:hypothetical protein
MALSFPRRRESRSIQTNKEYPLNNLNDFIKAMGALGEVYYNRYLVPYQSVPLESDWREALRFFFCKIFFQGRRDEVSDQFRVNAEKTIDSVLGGSRRFPDDNDIAHIEEYLRTPDVMGKRKMKRRDVEMVRGSIEFIRDKNEHNIVSLSLKAIEDRNLSTHHDKLQTIRQVGPKVASMYLRDLIQVFNLESKVSDKDDLLKLQPIDTWVTQIVKEFDSTLNTDIEYRRWIVDNSLAYGESPLKVNQGIWTLGSKALPILRHFILNEPNVLKLIRTLDPTSLFPD